MAKFEPERRKQAVPEAPVARQEFVRPGGLAPKPKRPGAGGATSSASSPGPTPAVLLQEVMSRAVADITSLEEATRTANRAQVVERRRSVQLFIEAAPSLLENWGRQAGPELEAQIHAAVERAQIAITAAAETVGSADPSEAQTRATGGVGTPSPTAGVLVGSANARPTLLVPQPSAPSHRIVLPDANHPAIKDNDDGELVIQTARAEGRATPAPVGHKTYKALATTAESVTVKDDSGDQLQIDITYRLESRPAEVGEVPDIWIYTKRKALLTLGSGEHAAATIVGDARVHLGVDELLDPKAAIRKRSIGPHHSAQVYLAEAGQYVNEFGPGGAESLYADAAGQDLFAYDAPLRTLVALKRILKKQHVAGRGAQVADMHQRANQLLAEAEQGRAVLEAEIKSVRSHHDRHPGMIAPVKWLASSIADWLATNRQHGRDHTEDARLVRRAHRELLGLIEDAEAAAPPPRDHVMDAVAIPGRFVARTATGIKQLGLMVADTAVLGTQALGEKTGAWHFDYDPISEYGQAIDQSGAGPKAAVVGIVNGFVDQWSDAIERASNGDFRAVEDVGIDTLMLLDGARTAGTATVEKLPELVGKVGELGRRARSIVTKVPVEVADQLAAFAEAADAFVAKQPAPMAMATAGGPKGGGPGAGGAAGGGPTLDTVAEGLDAATQAFKAKRAAQVKGRAIEKLTARIGPAKSPDVAAWVTRVEAALGGDARATARFLDKLQMHVADPAPFIAKVDHMLAAGVLGAEDLTEVLTNILSQKVRDPGAVLDEIAGLANRQLSAHSRSMLARRAAKGDVDLGWVRRTHLTDAELDVLGQDSYTSFKEFEEASTIPSRRAPGPLAKRPPADHGVGANAKIRGIAGEMAAQEAELPNGLKIVRRTLSDNAESSTDFELVTREGKSAELEVKGQRGENWKGMIDEYNNWIANPIPGEKEPQVARLVRQVEAGHGRGRRVYVAISDATPTAQRQRLLKVLKSKGFQDEELVFLSESDIVRVGKRLREHMGIPQPGGVMKAKVSL